MPSTTSLSLIKTNAGEPHLVVVHFIFSYIIERDLEEILVSTGLSLPRGTVAKLTKKLAQREKINYRHLTDKLVDKNGETRYEPGLLDDAAFSTENLALGMLLLFIFLNHSPCSGYGLRWLEATEGPEITGDTSAETVGEDGIVTYKGAVVNVAQNLTQLKKLESERDSALSKIHEQEVQLSESSSSSTILQY